MGTHIYVTIERKSLEKRNACKSGLAVFESLRAMQGRKHSVRVQWSPAAQVWLATSYPQFSSWLYEEGFVPRLSLRHADLQSADLQFAYLQSADLQSADLRYADLRYADLQSADLRYAYRNSEDLAIPGWKVVDGRLFEET